MYASRIALLLLFVSAVSIVLGIGIERFSSSPVTTKSVTPTRVMVASSSAQPTQTAPSEVMVKRVIDGDTIELTSGARVRYIGIDTPETVDPRKPVQCFGRQAKEENLRLVDHKTVRLVKDVSEMDRYGRLLRYVYVGETMVNDTLVREGFAHAVSFPPDVKYQTQLLAAQREAQEYHRGLWSGCQVENSINPTNASGSNPALCEIKGNISASGDKIYHLPGCGSYSKTAIDESVGERWFCTEIEAQTAGWRKAKNCP